MPAPKTIFVVDDSSANLLMAEKALKQQYRVVTLSSAAKMFAALKKVTPDLILLDIEMPEMNGHEAMKQLKASETHSAIPVIFLTGLTEEADEVHGFELGAIDFVTKPFSVPVLLNRIKHHLHIDELIRERTKQLIQLQNGIVFTLADMAESRDANTGGHIERTTNYIDILIKAMIERQVYAAEIDTWNLESVVSSARLHDIGKVAIPDAILNKPARLNEEEFEVMKTHAQEGERTIDKIIFRTNHQTFLHNAKLFAGCHHERWDGTGYPCGLKETNIPLQGRIMAVIDVYDALISERPYKKSFTHEEAVKIIMENSGLQFDPAIADVFYEIRDRFKAGKM